MTKLVLSEPAIHGVLLVAGLVVLIGNTTQAFWGVIVRIVATLVVFWIGHLYAGVVTHLGDEYEGDTRWRERTAKAARDALDHSWGMLVAGLIPLTVLTMGALNLIRDQTAIWGSLWAAMMVLGVLGWLGVASWTPRPSLRLLGGAITSLLGLALLSLIHI